MKADTLKNNLVLPLVLGAVIDAGNLDSWQVYLDGELQPTSSVRLQDGRLVVGTPHGLTVIVR